MEDGQFALIQDDRIGGQGEKAVGSTLVQDKFPQGLSWTALCPSPLPMAGRLGPRTGLGSLVSKPFWAAQYSPAILNAAAPFCLGRQ